MGMTIVFVIFANVLSVAGWGSYFPWAIPALFAGAGDGASAIEPVSHIIVVLTGLTGIAITYLWWQNADQHQ
jgi:ABC-2 type transport system permease protein